MIQSSHSPIAILRMSHALKDIVGLSSGLLSAYLLIFRCGFVFCASRKSYICYVIYSANNCLRIEFTYHRAVHIFRLESSSLRSGQLAMNLLGLYVRKCVAKSITLFFPSSFGIMFLSFFYRARSFNKKYKKLCTQVHFRCALICQLSTNELPFSSIFAACFTAEFYQGVDGIKRNIVTFIK